MRIRRGGASSGATFGDFTTGVVLVRYWWATSQPRMSPSVVININNNNNNNILEAHLYLLMNYLIDNNPVT